MSLSTFTAAQRQSLRDAAVKLASATQPFAQNAAAPSAAVISRIDPLVTAMVTAAGGASSPPWSLLLDRNIWVTGDSRTANGFSTVASPVNTVLESYGYGTGLGPFSGGRVRVTHARNGGVTGDTSTQWLARVPAMIASTPNATVFVVLISINDRGSAALTADQTKANIQAGLNLITAAGHIPVVVAELPNNFTTGTQLAYHLEVRRWIRDDLSAAGYLTVDPWVEMVDPASATYNALAGMLVDDRHPAPVGAAIIAKHVGRALEGVYKIRLALPLAATAYAPNATMLTTGASIGASALATGTLATGLVAAGSSWTGSTVVLGVTASPYAGQFQTIALSGAPTAAAPVLSLSQVFDVSGIAGMVGKTLRGLARIGWTGMVGVAGIALELTVTDANGTQYYKINDRYTTAFPVDATRDTLPYETPDYVVTGAETAIGLRMAVYAAGTSATMAGTIRLGQMTVDVR